MINITYGIFAEDAANEIFIEKAIEQLVRHFGHSDKIHLSHVEEYTLEVSPKSGGYVSKYFINYILKGIREKALDLCLVGRDSDDNMHLDLIEEMTQVLEQNKLIGKALIYIPVQAIEYWLWYIKIKKENPKLASTPIVDRGKGRIELKQLVYESSRKRISNKKSNPIVNELSQNIDFDWLNAHSASFKHFYHQFENYIKTKTAAEEEE